MLLPLVPATLRDRDIEPTTLSHLARKPVSRNSHRFYSSICSETKGQLFQFGPMLTTAIQSNTSGPTISPTEKVCRRLMPSNHPHVPKASIDQGRIFGKGMGKVKILCIGNDLPLKIFNIMARDDACEDSLFHKCFNHAPPAAAATMHVSESTTGSPRHSPHNAHLCQANVLSCPLSSILLSTQTPQTDTSSKVATSSSTLWQQPSSTAGRPCLPAPSRLPATREAALAWTWPPPSHCRGHRDRNGHPCSSTCLGTVQ